MTGDFLLYILRVFLFLLRYPPDNVQICEQPSPRVTNPNIVCYYPYGETNVQPENINATYCTHIILTGGYFTSDYGLSANVTVMKLVLQLKSQNPNLKFILEIGGGGSNSTLSQIVHSPDLTNSFCSQAITFLYENNYDGLDFDWEFPSFNGDPTDSQNLFPQFLGVFKNLTTERSLINGKPPLLLSLDVAAAFTIIPVSYNITEIAKYVDFINIMCYDFHYYEPYNPLTGLNAGLFKQENDIFPFSALNTYWAVNAWNCEGMPKSKINVAIASYGHSYTLASAENNGINALAVSSGSYGGWVDYSRRCKFLAENYTEVFDDVGKSPYGFNGTDWLSYENIESVTYKTNWTLINGFAGTMFFSLNSDDWNMTCDGETRLPLLKAVYETTLPFNV